METFNFAFVLHDCLLIGSGNPNFFVCGFKINTPVLQHSNTPCGLSRHSQLSLTPAEDGIFDPPTGRGFKRLNKDPGLEDPALVQPWKGVLCDLADFNLLLEYWSVGVMENWR